MIRCPKCGTLNRDGSRFCNECGAPLQRTSIRCPMCGALNPVGNIFCDRCHARLIPLQGVVPPEGGAKPSEEATPRVQGISLPTRTPAPESVTEGDSTSEGLPDWLQGLIENEVPTEGEPAAEAPQPQEEAGYPNWLEGLVPEETEQEVSETESATEPESFFEEEELPDWLADVSEEVAQENEEGEIEQEQPEPEEALALEDTPDWLSGLAPEEEPKMEANYEGIESFDWLSELGEEPTEDESDTSEAEEREETFPEWLSEQLGEKTSSEGVEAEEAQPSETLPEWLSHVSVEVSYEEAPETFETEVPGSGMPGWLSALSAKEPFEGPINYETESNAEELPDWLLTAGSEAEEPPEGEIPDWLAEREAAGETPLPIEPGLSTDEALPDWLETQPEVPSKEPVEGLDLPENLPTWTEEAEIPAEPEPTMQKGVSPFTEVEGEGEPLPDWLSGLDLEESEETTAKEAEPDAEELPDWLQQLMPEGEQEEAVSPFIELEEVETPSEKRPEVSATEAPEQELPDWLTSIAGEGPSAEVTSPFTEEPETALEQAPEPEARAPIFTESSALDIGEPDLDAEAVEPDTFAEGPEDEIEEEDLLETPLESAASKERAKGVEVPEWLRDLGPEAEELIIPETQAEGLEQAQVPAWLQELRPPGTGPLATGPLSPDSVTEAEVSAAGKGSGLIPAEIPDWVQELRPSGKAVAEKDLFETEVESISEMQGPLAGLEGILPALPLIDVPPDFQPSRREQVPEAVVEQAQLWQQLLEQPRGTQRPVAQKQAAPGFSEVLLRLTVAAALLVTILAAILGYLPTPLAQPPAQKGVPPLRRAIENLQPDDTVLVALEYGPGEAEEMAHISDMLLTHILDRKARIIMVTTLPEGESLILQQMASESFQTDSQLLTNRGYLPGGSSGIAQFLNVSQEANEADLVLVLAGRTDRLRWWVEQNLTQRAEPLPIGAGLSAAVGPLVTPYLNTRDNQGWLIGLPGAASYRQERGLRPDESLTLRLDALMLAQWVITGLLLGGAVYYLIAGKKGTA